MCSVAMVGVETMADNRSAASRTVSGPAVMGLVSNKERSQPDEN